MYGVVVFSIITNEVFGFTVIPAVNAFLFNQFSHFFDQFRGTWMQFVGVFMHEEWNWHAPRTLTRNTPVRTTFNHCLNPVFTPIWDKADLVFNCIQGALA